MASYETLGPLVNDQPPSEPSNTATSGIKAEDGTRKESNHVIKDSRKASKKECKLKYGENPKDSAESLTTEVAQIDFNASNDRRVMVQMCFGVWVTVLVTSLITFAFSAIFFVSSRSEL